MSGDRTTRHFTVQGRVGNKNGASVDIEPVRDIWIVKVRPKGLRRTYDLRLDTVADLVCWHVAKLEAKL